MDRNMKFGETWLKIISLKTSQLLNKLKKEMGYDRSNTKCKAVIGGLYFLFYHIQLSFKCDVKMIIEDKNSGWKKELKKGWE